MERRCTPAGARWMAALVGLAGLLVVSAPTARAADLVAGSSLLLRTSPGWDAPSAGEVAPGTPVSVYGDPVVAADGSLWYQVDGGFLPAGGLSGGGEAVAAQEAPVDQTVADPNAAGGTWTDPNAAGTTDGAWTDPNDPNAGATGGGLSDANPGGDGTVEAPASDPALAAPAAAQAPIGTAWIAGTDGDGAVCRSSPDWGASEVGLLPEGSSVDVVGGTVGEWQPVNCGGLTAYVHASFISWQQPTAVDPPAPPATTDAAPVADTTATSAESRQRRGGGSGDRPSPGSGGGQSIVDFAMQYVGYPYAYAGAGPSAFDCSGFTMFVVQQTLGINISHDLATQASSGTPVSRDALQPGDLVFFQNTFQPGISHAGIYIGNGQFVHAENESTGVIVSDINNDYYSSRWYGAVRLT